jgi:hypothetical protein
MMIKSMSDYDFQYSHCTMLTMLCEQVQLNLLPLSPMIFIYTRKLFASRRDP